MSISIIKNEPIGKHTFYGVGGIADEWYTIKSQEGFAEIWAETHGMKIPAIVLGKGSNSLFSDLGFRGRVFSIEFENCQWKTDSLVRAESGKNWQAFVEETNKKGFSDLCSLSGIPGNIGGFIRGNAGAFGSEVSDTLQAIEYIDEHGNTQLIPKKEAQFEYRSSIFKKNPQWCITAGIFAFDQKADPEESLQKTRDLLKDRWKKYPAGRTGGSFFKNPENHFTGKLLDELGAKGDQIGMAQIAEKHANFILNKDGKATQKDILALARKWKAKVWEAYQIELEAEIFICDEYGRKEEI